MNTIKRIALVIMVPLFSFSCFKGEKKTSQHPTVSNIELWKLDFSFSVIRSVTCSSFHKSIGDEADYYALESREEITAILNSLSKSVVDQEASGPDTRVVLKVNHRNGNIDSLCVGQFEAWYNGTAVTLEDSLRNYLENLGHEVNE